MSDPAPEARPASAGQLQPGAGAAEEAGRGARLADVRLADRLAFLTDVVLPTFGKGVILRRPAVVALAERFDLDHRAVRRMQALRRRYGGGPLMMDLLGRKVAVLLEPEHVRRVLDGTPEPFSPASNEKRSALGHFEAAGSLVSTGRERAQRRAFSATILGQQGPNFAAGSAFARIVDEEVTSLLSWAGTLLDWLEFSETWQRIVRRMVLGSAARDDRALTDVLTKLRAAANWAMFHPGHPRLVRELHERIRSHLDRAEPESLAARAAAVPATRNMAPSDQIAHWLFAFDAAGIATWRALALIAAHPARLAHMRRALRRGHAEGEDLARDAGAHLRAAILEALRLWPTTPAILRQTTTATEWPGGVMPADTRVLIYAPYFHRDDEQVANADRFAPQLWLDGSGTGDARFVMFSAGPGACPGENLVLATGSEVLARLIRDRDVVAAEPQHLDPLRPMPGTLDHTAVRFRLLSATRDTADMGARNGPATGEDRPAAG